MKKSNSSNMRSRLKSDCIIKTSAFFSLNAPVDAQKAPRRAPFMKNLSFPLSFFLYFLVPVNGHIFFPTFVTGASNLPLGPI